MIHNEPVTILIVGEPPGPSPLSGDLGLTLVRAPSGEDALKRVVEADLAAVLLDVAGSGSSDLELARRIRDLDPRVPILFLGTGEDFPLEAAYGLGTVDHLPRPFLPFVLRAKVACLAEQSRRSRAGGGDAGRSHPPDDARGHDELWRTTLASIGDAVIATDTDGRVTFLNPVAEQLTGWPMADALGTHLTEVFRIVNESTHATIPNPAVEALRTGLIVGLAGQTILVARDGVERPIDDSSAPIRNDAGAVSGAVLIFRDISERKQAEVAHARLAAIVESSHDAIVGKDLDGTIRSWNGGAERIFGYSAAEVIGRSITLVIPEARLDEERVIQERLGRGERVDHFETQRVRKDGQLVDLALTISPIRDAGGVIVGASKVARDVTDAKRAERALASALQAGEVGTYFWDVQADRVTGDRNFIRLFGVLIRDRASAPIADFLVAIHPDDRDRVVAEIEGTLATDAPFRSEYRVTGPGGERWLLARGAVERAAGGDPIGWAGAVVDITDRKQAEEALAASRARLDFAVQASGIGFWYCDLPFDELQWDERVKAHFWLPADARVTIGTFYERIHPDDREPTRAAIDRSVTERAGYDVHFRTVDPATRDEKWIRAIGRASYDEAGTANRFDGVTLDMTHQRVAETAVRESNDRFTIVARATNDAVWDWDMRTNAVWWNEGVTALFGYSRAAVGPDSGWWIGRFHPDDRERVVGGIHAVIDRGGSNWSEEYRFRKADGDYATVLDRAYAIHEGGKTVRLVGAMQDVTERKRAEMLLREKDERLQLLVDRARDYAVVVTDRHGKVLEWSGGAENITGFAPQEMLGRPAALIFTAEDRAAGVPLQEMEQAAGDGRVEDKRWHVRKDGDQFFADGVMVPLRGDDGALHGFGKVFRDVTPRKRAEEAVLFLADASASLAELVDPQSTLNRIANLAVAGFADWCVVDMIGEDGTRERLAVTATAGSQDLANARDEDMASLPADTAASVVPHVLRTGEPEVVTDLSEVDPATAAQGPERLARLRALGIRSYLSVPLLFRGRVVGGMTFLSSSPRRRFGPEELRVGVNLAERVAIAIENAQLYRTLQEQDRRKDEFLATLAHELRNPLAPVRNGLQILRLGGVHAETAGETLSMMDRQLGHITHLVDDLMDVARVSSGKVALRLERIPLRGIVDAAVETSRQVIEAAHHELTLRVAREPLVIEADRTRLVQILANLLHNAAKYTPQGGRIMVRVTRDGGQALIRVSDTGVGIPAAMLPRVFEMFTQVGTSLERSQGGLGIGLMLVKRLVEMHGGTVAAESPGPEQGSTFVVRLPLAEVAAPPVTQPPVAAVGPVRRQLEILVVDDNRDSAVSLARLLKMQGHQVKTAHDGPETLQLLANYRPHLILLDLGLPGMSGYEVARRIRESTELRGVTLAALTGWGQEEDRRRTREAGFDHHLVKPADPDELMRVVESVRPRD